MPSLFGRLIKWRRSGKRYLKWVKLLSRLYYRRRQPSLKRKPKKVNTLVSELGHYEILYMYFPSFHFSSLSASAAFATSNRARNLKNLKENWRKYSRNWKIFKKIWGTLKKKVERSSGKFERFWSKIEKSWGKIE